MPEVQKQLAEKFNRFINRYGWKGLVAIIFYPVITLVTTPVRLTQTLWNCRVLADAKWGDYNRFAPVQGLNSLFYRTQAIILSRYGRSGTCPYIGTGNYFIGRWWYITPLSLFAYEKEGAIVPLVGMFGWWAGHFLWLDQDFGNWAPVLITAALAIFSTTFFSNVFVRQNYNALGWLFVPLGLHGWLTENYVLAAFAWLGASFTSVTVVFIGGLLALGWSLKMWNMVPIITVFPSAVKILTHFWPFAFKEGFFSSILNVVNAIGLHNSKSKYKHGLKIGIIRVYYIALCLQFVMFFYFTTASFPYLVGIGILIYLINARFARFSDDQSMQMLLLSLSCASMLSQGTMNILLLISFWLMISPIPFAAGIPESKHLCIVPEFKPFYVKPIIQDIESFLAPIQPGARILMAFDNPGEEHMKIFDGYRHILEPLLYVAALKKVHLLPDWHAVFELNYKGAPDFWGRAPDIVRRQVQAWKADSIIVYQKSGTQLDESWGQAGFKKLSYFPWAPYEDEFGDLRPYRVETPDWWLLKANCHE